MEQTSIKQIIKYEKIILKAYGLSSDQNKWRWYDEIGIQDGNRSY